MPDYTITIALDGSKIPYTLKLYADEVKIFSNTVDSAFNKASSSVKNFSVAADDSLATLKSAFTVIKEQISYYQQYNDKLNQSEQAARSFKATKQAEIEVSQLGINVLTEEGAVLTQLVEAKNRLIQVTKLKEDVYRKEAAATLAAVDADIKATAKRQAGIAAIEQETASLQAKASALLLGVEAERANAVAEETRIAAQRLGIEVGTQEYAVIERNIAAQAELRAQIENTVAANETMIGGFGSTISMLASLAAFMAAMKFKEFISDSVQAVVTMAQIQRAIKVSSGDARIAGDTYAYMRGEVMRLGLDLKGTGEAFSKLDAASIGTKLHGQGVKDIFTALAQTSSVLDLSVERTNLILYAVQQMMSKGTVSAIQLRRELGQSLPGAMQIAARAMGVTTAELDKMMRSGKLMADDFLPRFAKELNKTFGSGLEDAVNSLQSKLNRFNTTLFETKVAFGDGFTPYLEKAMQEQIDFLTNGEVDAKEFGKQVGEAFLKVIEILIELEKHLDQVKAALLALIVYKTILSFLELAKALEIAAAQGKTLWQILGIANPEFVVMAAVVAAVTAAFYLYSKSIDDGTPSINTFDKALMQHRDLMLEVKATTLDLAAVQSRLAQTNAASLQREGSEVAKQINDLKQQIMDFEKNDKNKNVSAFETIAGLGSMKSQASDIAERENYNQNKIKLQELGNEYTILASKYGEARIKAKEFADNLETITKKTISNRDETDQLSKSEERRLETIQARIDKEKSLADLEDKISNSKQKQADLKLNIEDTVLAQGVTEKYSNSLVKLLTAQASVADGTKNISDGMITLSSSMHTVNQTQRVLADYDTTELQTQKQKLSNKKLLLEASVQDKQVTEQYGVALTKLLAGYSDLSESVNKYSIEQKQAQAIASAGRDLTDQDTKDIKDSIETRERARQQTQRNNEVDSAANQLRRDAIRLIDQINTQQVNVQLHTPKQQIEDLNKDLSNLKDVATPLRIALTSLIEGTAAYGTVSGALNKVIAEQITLTDKLGNAQKQQQIDINVKATEAVDKYVAKLSKEQSLTLASADSQKAYNRELAIEAEIIRQIGDKKIDPETYAKLATQIRDALTKGFQLEDYKKDILDPLNNAVSSMKQTIIDGLADAFTGTKVNWENLLKDMLKMWIKTILEMELKQLELSAIQAATSRNGGGGYAGSNVAGGGQFAGLIGYGMQAYSAYNSGTFTIGGGTAGISSLFGGSAYGGGTTGAFAAVGAWVAVWAAVYLAASQWVATHKNHISEVTLSLVKEGKLAVNNVQHAGDYTNQIIAGLVGAGKQVTDFISSLGGVMIGIANDISLKKKGQGSSNQFTVLINGIATSFGRDYDAALQFAAVQAAKMGVYKGLDPITAQAIKNTVQTQWDAFQKDVQEAQTVAMMAQPAQVQDMMKLNQQVDQLIADMYRILGPSEAFDQAVKNITASMVTSLQGERDAITGRQQTAAENLKLRQQESVLWNAELAQRKVKVQMDLLQAKADLAAYDAARHFIGTTGGGSGGGAGGGILGVGGALLKVAQMADVAAAGIVVATDATRQAMLDNINTLQALWNALDQIKPIDLNEIVSNRGGSGNTTASDRQGVQTFIHDYHVSQMSDYNQALAKINEEIDKEIKLAHGDKKAIADLNAIRQQEIDALNKQTKAKLDPWLKDYGKDDFQKNVDTMKELFDAARKLPTSVMPRWMIDLAQGRWLQDQVKTLNTRINTLGGQDPILDQIQKIRDENKAINDDILSLEKMGLSADAAAILIAKSNEAAQKALNAIGRSIVGGLLDSVKDDPKYHDEYIAFQKESIRLQYALIEAQMKQLGIWDANATLFNDALTHALNAVDVALTSYQQSETDRRIAAAQEAAQAKIDAEKQLRDLAKSFYALIDQLSAYRKSLLQSDLSPLTARQKYTTSQTELNKLIPLALSGDTDALGKIQAAIDTFLKNSQAINQSGAGYIQDFNFIQDILHRIEQLQFTQNGTIVPRDANAPLITAVTTNANSVNTLTASINDLNYNIYNINNLTGSNSISIPSRNSIAIKPPSVISGGISNDNFDIVNAINRLSTQVETLNTNITSSSNATVSATKDTGNKIKLIANDISSTCDKIALLVKKVS